MRQVNVRFERDENTEQIDVVVRAPERDAQVDALIEHLSGRPPDLLTVSDEHGALCRIAADDVVSVSVSGKLTQIVTEDGRYTARQPLQALESALDGRRFVRISRYELVNLDKVRKYDFSLGGTLRLELAGGMETWASRRCIPAIRARLNGKE